MIQAIKGLKTHVAQFTGLAGSQEGAHEECRFPGSFHSEKRAIEKGNHGCMAT